MVKMWKHAYQFIRPRNYSSFKTVNLDRLTQYLQEDGIPNLLLKNFDSAWLSNNIKLNLFPYSLPFIPVFQGLSQYNTSINALRLITNKILLPNNKPKLHISSFDLLNSNQSQFKDYKFLTNNTKIVVHWQSCAKKNLSVASDDTVPNNLNSSMSEEFENYIIDFIKNPTANKLEKTMMNQFHSSSDNSNHILKGIFIFELSEDNSNIDVHTIEDVQLMKFKKKVQQEGGAFAC